MCDLPTGPALLALARDVLLNDLLPLLPEAARLDARLVGNGMAIAEREAIAGDGPGEAILWELREFYSNAALARPAPSGIAGEHPERGEGPEGEQDLLHRFAQDLRVGAFEHSDPARLQAREVLWRLTIAKLRRANPRFLHANGFS